MRDEPGYDPVLQAHTGIMSVIGEPGRAPVRLGISALNLGSALWATVSVALAGPADPLPERAHRRSPDESWACPVQ